MVFNATFNKFPAISWRSVISVEETTENRRPVVNQWQTLPHNIESSTPDREPDVSLEFQFKYIKPIFKWMLYPCLHPVNHLSTQA